MTSARTPARFLPPLALLVLVALFFWKLAFTNLILARGDTFLYFYPYWQYRAQALLAGRLPLWNPLLFMGAPFLANSQAGVLYPFNWPLAVFAAPVAVKIAVLAHVGLAALGAYTFARRALGQSALAAVMAGVLFALGGYVTAQVEHVNQLQGLAWLPWAFLFAHRLAIRSKPPPVRQSILGLAIVFALQLLAGHAQTLVITGVGVALYMLVLGIAGARAPTTDDRRRTTGLQSIPMSSEPPGLRRHAEGSLKSQRRSHPPTHSYTRTLTHSLASTLTHLHTSTLLPAALLALLLSAAQLLPTLELSAQSLRGGGLALREALSFSLDPRLLGRALLPAYSRALFSEFVAFSGVAGLVLAVLGWRRSPAGWALLALCVLGLGFALGAYNPVYAGLALLPPFNLFRVPARWLLLLAFGLALLAGQGLDAIAAARPRRAWALLAPVGLMALTLLANGLAPAGETGPLPAPALGDWLGWGLALIGTAGLLWLPRAGWTRASGLAVLAAVELFAAGRALPYNHPTAPSAYSSVRPAMTQLLLEACRAGQAPAAQCAGVPPEATAPGRFLSMSALRFDPGDLAELHGAWDPQLPAGAVDDYIVATKHKEVLSPNLPLAWGIAAVDGYDGGVLPLAHYAAFTQLFTGAPSSDGRLRENLNSAPDPRLLALVGGRYLITDKVGDAWIDGIFYDLQFTVSLIEGESTEVAYLPAFEATALGLVAEGAAGRVRVEFADGARLDQPAGEGRVRFAAPGVPVRVSVSGPLTVRGLSLIDERTGAFQTLALGPYRLVHSGDVKIYENLAVLPRAFVAPNARVIAGEAEARAALADPAFVPADTVILAEAPKQGLAPGAAASAVITHYAPERVSITAEGPGYLLLTDAHYPGWVARVDGQRVPILRADLMFRAVPLGPGAHTIEFSYEPLSVKVGLGVSGAAWLLTLAALLWGIRANSTRVYGRHKCQNDMDHGGVTRSASENKEGH